MADFGSDVGNNTAQITARTVVKLAELLANLIKSIIISAAEYNSPENKMAREKLKEMETNREKREYASKLENMGGYVAHKKLADSGVPLSTIGLENKVTKEEFKHIIEICDRNNVLVTGIKEPGSKLLDEKPTYILQCRTSDLERFKDCIMTFNKEKRVMEINADLKKYENKGLDKLSQKERLDRAGLIEEKASIIRGYRNEMNDEQSQSAVHKAAGIKPKKCADFSEALNRNTGRHLNKDVTFVIAEMADPSKHIKCHGAMDTFRGKEYIKTDYEVYNDDKLVMKTHDGRFEGRPIDYWNEQKADMQRAGNFEGELLRFNSVGDYEKFMGDLANENEAALNFIRHGENNRDYADIIGKLEKHLDDNGFAAVISVITDPDTDKKDISVGVIDKKSGAPINIDANAPMTMDKKINAECIVVGNQIALYNQMKYVQEAITIAKAEILLHSDGTPEMAAAQVKLENLEKSYDSLKNIEGILYVQRQQINSAKIEFAQRNEPEQTREQPEAEIKAEGDNGQAMAEWQAGIAAERENSAGDKNIQVNLNVDIVNNDKSKPVNEDR